MPIKPLSLQLSKLICSQSPSHPSPSLMENLFSVFFIAIDVKVDSDLFTKHHEQKADRAIEEYIVRQINWAGIEDELVGSDLSSGKTFGYVRRII